MSRARIIVAFLISSGAVVLLGLTRPLVGITTETSHHATEDKLAGLRPGQDTVRKARHIFKRDPDLDLVPREISWWDRCNRQRALVSSNSTGTIEGVTVDPLLVQGIVDCSDAAGERGARAKFGTSHDLLLRDKCERIEEIYGAPNTKRSLESRGELYSYNFEAAHEKPALTLGITCDTGVDQVSSLKLAVSAK